MLANKSMSGVASSNRPLSANAQMFNRLLHSLDTAMATLRDGLQPVCPNLPPQASLNAGNRHLFACVLAPTPNHRRFLAAIITLKPGEADELESARKEAERKQVRESGLQTDR